MGNNYTLLHICAYYVKRMLRYTVLFYAKTQLNLKMAGAPDLNDKIVYYNNILTTYVLH